MRVKKLAAATGLVFLLIGLLLGCSTLKISKTANEPEPPTVAGLKINPNQLSADKDFKSVDLYLRRIAEAHQNQQSRKTTDQNTGKVFSQTVNWWVEYRRGELWEKRNHKIACANFSKLALNPTFPLRQLAYLHAVDTCWRHSPALKKLPAFHDEKFSSWLKDLANDVALDRAKRRHDDKKLIGLYLQKSRDSLRREEKTNYSELALTAAFRAKDKKAIPKILNRIYSLSPSRNLHPDPQNYLSVANDYRYRRDFKMARIYYYKILRLKQFSTGDKLAAFRGLRLTFKIELQREKALKVTKQMAGYISWVYRKSKKTPDDVRLYTDTMMTLAREFWTDDDDAAAKKTLRAIERQVKGRGSLADVYFVRGRMAEEKQHFKIAINWFQKALLEPNEPQNYKDRLLWYLAWNERKAGQYAQAISILQDLSSRSENAFERDRYRFWLAKTYEIQHDSRAKSEFQSLVSDGPFSYYGLLAARELDQPLPVKSIRSANPNTDGMPESRLVTSRLKKWMDPVYFDWLVATNETQIAGRYLDEVAKKLKKDDAQDTKSWVALLRAFSRSQNYLSMFNELNQLDSDTRHEIIENNPEMMFPAPYFETVAQSAGRFGISTEFIYSIMRQESSFNPKARSQMDAMGLMQLLPQVAKRSAEENSISYRSTNDLYEPHVNIPIGSAYLRQLWDKYNGQVILAAASYNARDEAIASWLKTRYRGDTLEFIEDIPYDETRDYVKLVLRNLITYQIINNRDDTMNFPEWALKISYQPSASTRSNN